MFCKNCGKEIKNNSSHCSECGVEVTSNSNVSSALSNTQNNLINELISKIKINAIIWLAIAAVQIILGLLINWMFLIIGVLNIISAIKDIQYINTISSKPVGIVKKYKPITEPIITLVYNLIFGGVIGVAGSIYYLLAIRTFVVNNEQAFNQIESEFQNSI